MIYFIQHGDGGAIKIGSTTYLPGRFAHLQMASPVELVLLATQEGDATAERELHRRFARVWIRGEWFKPRKRLLRYIATLNNGVLPEPPYQASKTRPKPRKKNRQRLQLGQFYPPKIWLAIIDDLRSNEAERIGRAEDTLSTMVPSLTEKLKAWATDQSFGATTVLCCPGVLAG